MEQEVTCMRARPTEAPMRREPEPVGAASAHSGAVHLMLQKWPSKSTRAPSSLGEGLHRGSSL
jgi:hypothetical protein